MDEIYFPRKRTFLQSPFSSGAVRYLLTAFRLLFPPSIVILNAVKNLGTRR